MHSWRKLSRVFTNQSFAAFKVDDTVQILSSQIRTPIAIPHYPHLRFLVVRWRVYCVVGVIGQGESMAVLDHAHNCIIVTAGFPDPCTVGRDSATQIYLVCVVTIIWYYFPRTKPWWIKKNDSEVFNCFIILYATTLFTVLQDCISFNYYMQSM